LTVILKTLLLPLQKVSLYLFPPKEFDGIQSSADKSAKDFHNYFQNIFPPTSSTATTATATNSNSNSNATTTTHDPNINQNPFSKRGYTKTLLEAHRHQQLCFLYLHSPLHPQSHTFCQLILRHPNVLQYLNQCIVWGNSIHTAEGAHIAEMLHVSSYPYCALLKVGGPPSPTNPSPPPTPTNSPTPTNHGNPPPKVELVWKMEGLEYSGMTTHDVQTGNGEKLVRGMQTVIRAYQAFLAELESRRLHRAEEVRLRQEQDREFQEALLADQEQERERLRQAQEEEERCQAQKRLEMEALEKKETLLKDCRWLLEERGEPPPKTPDTTRLRITLPTGKKMERRFYSKDTIRHVRAFVRIWMQENNVVPIERFSLSSNYPKKTFEEEDLTLEDGGLTPMAVLMIQDLDA